jgi:hypothetical protein
MAKFIKKRTSHKTHSKQREENNASIRNPRFLILCHLGLIFEFNFNLIKLIRRKKSTNALFSEHLRAVEQCILESLWATLIVFLDGIQSCNYER